MSKLDIADLLNAFSNNQQTQNNEGPTKSKKSSKATEEFLVQDNMKVKQIKKKDQIKMKRQLNYKATQQDMDKWLGIVKINREKQTLDLTKKQREAVKVNFFPSKPVSQLQAKTEKILADLSMKNQAQIMKAEQKQLNKVDPEEAKRRLIEARRHRSMVFQEQIKRRRIAKIKSKLYHKIKKRQKLREEQKKIETMTPHQKSEYMQKLTRNRIKERISLRHNTKNKHIQNLLRFSKYNKDSIQEAMNEVNQIRQKQLEKNKIDEQILGNLSEEYDDENYREQAIMDLQRQLEEMEQEHEQKDEDNKPKGLSAMKFMQVAKQKQVQKDIQDAYKIINQLQNQDSEQIALDSDEQAEGKETKNMRGENNEGINQVSRKVFGADKPDEAKHANQNIHNKKEFIKKNIQQTLFLGDNIEELTKGLNLQNLKDKYQPQRVDLKLNEELLEMNRNIFNNNETQNQAVLQNLREFQEDKQLNLEADIEPENKKLKGWGSWAGPNIKAKAVDPQAQIKKKLAKIEEIKRKRKDGELTNVIVNQVRNKQLKDYMVRKLPHEYTTVEQFEYLNQSSLGPQWNTLTQFKANIKPKVVTKVGQVIEPIKLPRKITKV